MAQHDLNQEIKMRMQTLARKPTLIRPFITPKQFEPENIINNFSPDLKP